MRAEEIMTKPIITCQSNEMLEEAARKLWDHDCGVIVIVDDKGRLVGMLTDRDICMAAFTQGRMLTEIPIHVAMARTVYRATPQQSTNEIQELMASKQIRRIPVVDIENKPIGIITVNDLVRDVVRPSSKVDGGIWKVVRTLSAVCQPRGHAQDIKAA